MCLHLIVGCENKNQLIPGSFNGFDKIVKVVINKSVKSDYFLGVDNNGINLSLTAYDNKGDTIFTPEKAVTFYSNGVKLPVNTFVPDRDGQYTITGKVLGKDSDSLLIRVWDTATLNLSLNLATPRDQFYASGTDTLFFKLDVLKDGLPINFAVPYKLYVNDKEQSNSHFTTTQPGNYKFQAFEIFLNANHIDINHEGGRTEEVLAHEAGHFLGLYHVFDETNQYSCQTADPDFCSDTPIYNRHAYLNTMLDVQKYKRISCDGIEYNATNIMDYAYTHNNSFTMEQVKRMRHTINYGLWLPTPFNNSGGMWKAERTFLVKRPAKVKVIKPIVCQEL
jgi:hypothetical protein